MGNATAVIARRSTYGSAADARSTKKPSMRLSIRDIDHVRAALETWARWRYGGSTGEMSMTGKLMSGVASNICPLWLNDVIARKPHDPYCRFCQGRGRVKLKASLKLVNPAAIRGTGISYGDVSSGLIEKLVMSWCERDSTVWLNKILIAEYCENWTQETKAKGMRISLSFYEKRLHEAHFAVEQMLDDKLPRADVAGGVRL